MAMRLSEAYYLGEQVVDNLRIAVPAELEFLREVLNWPALAVDPYVERHAPRRVPPPERHGRGRAPRRDVVTRRARRRTAARGHRRAVARPRLVDGRAPETGDLPKVTVESPLNISADWDLTGRCRSPRWRSTGRTGGTTRR
jgi:hypothetical protein